MAQVRHSTRAQILLHVLVVEAASDEALCSEESSLGVRHCLSLGGGAHEALAVVGEADDRGRRTRPLRVLDHLG